MSNYRNGVYVAFNGMGTTDPTKSDMKYYGLLQQWNKSNNFDLSFSDSHKKTYSVRDSSQEITLKNRLLERLRSSKILFLIATDHASINRGLLNWEIEKAVETYELPLIVCYPGYNWVQSPGQLRDKWPDKLKEYVDDNRVKSIHIPFKKALIEEAINQFSVHSPPKYTLTHYTDAVYQKHGIK